MIYIYIQYCIIIAHVTITIDLETIVDNILGYDVNTRQLYATSYYNNRRAVMTRTMNVTTNGAPDGAIHGNYVYCIISCIYIL